MPDPARGEIWVVDLDPVRGREQAGRRPALVVSDDLFNSGPADLVVVLPLTTQQKGIPFHVQIDPPEGGLKSRSFVKCEDVRSLSKQRFVRRWGSVNSPALDAVEDRLRILLNL